MRLLAAVAGLAGLASVLWWAGAALPPPSSFDRTGLEQWLHADPAVAAFAGLRLLGLVLVGWVALTGAVGLVVHRTPLRRWGGLRRAVDRLCLPVVRRLVHGAAGGALSVAVLVPASTALAAPSPPITITAGDAAVAASASTPGGVAVLVPVEASPGGPTPPAMVPGAPSTADDGRADGTRAPDAPGPRTPAADGGGPGSAAGAASAAAPLDGAAEVAALEPRPAARAEVGVSTLAAPPGPTAPTEAPGPVPDPTPAAVPERNDGPAPTPAVRPHQVAEHRPAPASSSGPPNPAPPLLEIAVLVALVQPAAPPPPMAPPPVEAHEAPEDRWVVQRGEHLWHVSQATLERRLGAAPSDDAVAGYLQMLIAANRDRLVCPDDPDLVFAGQELVLPPTDGSPTGAG